MTPIKGSDGGTRSTARVSAWAWLLLIPYIGLLWVPFYNSVEPTIFGLPFFYAYQMAFVLLTSALIGIVYFMTSPP